MFSAWFTASTRSCDQSQQSHDLILLFFLPETIVNTTVTGLTTNVQEYNSHVREKNYKKQWFSVKEILSY